MHKISKILIIAFFIAAGCNPLGLPEASSDYEVRGEVIAFVCPDTVQVDVPFTVQVSYPNICGGSFSRMWIFETAGTESVRKIVLSPIVHVKPQTTCPTNYSVNTVTSELQLNTIGRFELVADGHYGQLTRFVQVVSNWPARQNYHLRYEFVDNDRYPIPNQVAAFGLTDSNSLYSVNIYSDSAGIWDTTITKSPPQLRYHIDQIYLEAKYGITDHGVILFR